jgi:hypothetical protein
LGATAKSKRERWQEIAKETKDCTFCGPNRGENAKRRAKPDKYKRPWRDHPKRKGR